MKTFRYLEIRFDSEMRVIEIKVENLDIAIKLANYLKDNWAFIFSHDLHGFVIHHQSYGYEPDVNYSTIIDWSGPENMLTDIYYELIRYTTYDRNPLKIDKYLDFNACNPIPFRTMTLRYHYDSRPIGETVARVKIEEPDYQIYTIPGGRRNGKGMIMANNNNLEIAHHSYTKEFYKRLANNLYGYTFYSSRGNSDIRNCIKKVQINEKKKVVTIVWKFGEPTIARCGANDTWDPEKGILVCIAKHMFVSGTQMNKWLKEQIPESDPETAYQPKHAGNE